MDLIEAFINRYQKEYDFYDHAGRLVAQILEANLQGAGIRSIVTSRAKSIGRLEAKVKQRNIQKNYASLEDIYADIVDLAGVRVALYFPGESLQVGRIIKDMFLVEGDPKEFPSGSAVPPYAKRFSGYYATHYRVRLRETILSQGQERYGQALIEVQVASVLMHAWAEVEHDLVYKPLQGKLSEEEYSILDELNGLVIAGEIALERLQKAGETRVSARGRKFSNHYDLATHLINAAGAIIKGTNAVPDTALGRVDILFGFLSALKMATPDSLNPYVESLHSDIERRPLAEQIIDQLLLEDDSRYQIYEDIRTNRPVVGGYGPRTSELEPDAHMAMGEFLSQWIALERVIRDRILAGANDRHMMVPLQRVLKQLPGISDDVRREIGQLRMLRNQVVHGIEVPTPVYLREAASRLQSIRMTLQENRTAPPTTGQDIT